MPPAHKNRIIALLHLSGEAITLGFLRPLGLLRWLTAVIFHLCLLLVFVRHLRYFLWPVPAWITALQYPGIIAGHLLPLLLLLLIFRRIAVRSLFLISSIGDFILLFFMLTLSLSGLALRHFFRVDLVEIKTLGLGLLKLAPRMPEEPGLFLFHFLLALVFFSVFPFTKLIHGPGLFFTPTRAQADDLAESLDEDSRVMAPEHNQE